jgi:hypothetical protein
MPKILDRLESQLAAKGMGKAQAAATATSVLQKAGDLKKGSTVATAKGAARGEMGAAGRAKDRAAKAGGHKASEYAYNQLTNTARLKKAAAPKG